MARVRSPNYPTLSLPEAIKLVTTIHAAEQHLAAPKEVVAKHLGYSGMHGLAGRVVSAIEKYGLLEEVTGDKVKVSSLAMSILFPATPEEKKKATNEAAYRPSLFATIKEEWQGERPSDENLRVYLIRRKFSTDALDRVIQVYRETMDLVTQESMTYPANQGMQMQPEKPEKQNMQIASRQQPPPPPSASGAMSVAFNGDFLQVNAVLEDGDAVDKLIKALAANKVLLPEKRPLNEETDKIGASEDGSQ